MQKSPERVFGPGFVKLTEGQGQERNSFFLEMVLGLQNVQVSATQAAWQKAAMQRLFSRRISEAHCPKGDFSSFHLAPCPGFFTTLQNAQSLGTNHSLKYTLQS